MSDLSLAEVEARIRAAVAARATSPHAAVRVVDGAGDGLPGLVVERFAEAHRARGRAHLVAWLPALRAALGEPLFWRFTHAEAGGPPHDDGLREIDEGDLRWQVRLKGSRNTGLFLDGRAARRWVREHAEGRRVLNLFAYTCAFGAAAAAGGARATTNVDSAPGALARGRAAYELNGLRLDGRTFWRSAVKDALRKLARQGTRFDGIILDPPPLLTRTRSGRRVDARADLARLAGRCRGLLAAGGWLLILCAHADLTDEAIEDLAGLGRPTWRGLPPPDFRPQGAGLRALAFTSAEA